MLPDLDINLAESPRSAKKHKIVGFEDDGSDYYSASPSTTPLFNKSHNDKIEPKSFFYQDTDDEQTEDEMDKIASKMNGLKVSEAKKCFLPHLIYKTKLDSVDRSVLCIDIELPMGANEDDVHIEFVDAKKGQKQKIVLKYLYSYPFLSMKIFESAQTQGSRDEYAIALARKAKIRELVKFTDPALVTAVRPKHIVNVMEIPLPERVVNYSNDTLVQIKGSGPNINSYKYANDGKKLLCANIVLVVEEDKKILNSTPQKAKSHSAALDDDDLKAEMNEY